MFSSNSPPPPILTPPSRPNFITVSSATAQNLPSGGCRFILLHPSIPDQRCSCQAFRRNESRPGANCECGHQACYHATVSCNPRPEVEPVSKSTPQSSLLDRISRLEEQYHNERRMWQEELKEERRARREDTRVLREAMYAFYKFMEKEVPDKFVSVEDKLEGVLDQMLRLQERVGMIDDSTMALENRLADIEGDGEGDHVPELEKDNEEQVDDEPTPKRHRTESPQNGNASPELSREQNSVPGKRTSTNLRERTLSSTLIAPPGRPNGSQPSCLDILPARSPSKPDSSVPPTDSAVYPSSNFAAALEFLNAPAPMGAHTYVHILSSPQDLISPLFSKESDSAHKSSNFKTPQKFTNTSGSSSSSSPDDQDEVDKRERAFPILSRPQTSFRPSFPLSTSMLKKRRRDVLVLRSESSNDGRKETLPSEISVPPPLSLS